jgi:hypothetical protein
MQRFVVREFLALVENLAERAAFHPLHRDIDALGIFYVENFDDARMAEFFADRSFTVEAVVKERIGFESGVRDFDGDGRAVRKIERPKDSGHAAARYEGLNAESVDEIAGFESGDHSCGALVRLSCKKFRLLRRGVVVSGGYAREQPGAFRLSKVSQRP